MARGRRMLAPLVTIKHMLNIENAQIAASAIRTIVIVKAVGQSAVSAVSDVVEGSLVKTCYIEQWLKSFASAGTDVKFQLVLEKVPAGATPITFTQLNNLMTYPNKKNIFFTTQGVLGDLTTQSMPVLRDWYSIPKGKQRFGLDDELVVTIGATSAVLQSCGLAIFKEWK